MRPEVKQLLEDLKKHSNKSVTLFTLDGCPACMELKSRLDRLDIVYENIDMDMNVEKWKELESLGGADYVPQVMIENNLIKDYEDMNELLSKVLSEIVERKIIIT